MVENPKSVAELTAGLKDKVRFDRTERLALCQLSPLSGPRLGLCSGTAYRRQDILPVDTQLPGQAPARRDDSRRERHGVERTAGREFALLVPYGPADRRSPGARQRLPVRPAGGISRPRRELPGRTGSRTGKKRSTVISMPISDGRADGLDFRPATDARTIFSRNSLSGKGTAPSNPCLGMPYSVHSHYCFQASDEDEPATRAQRLPERSSERTDNRGGRASEAEIAEATYHTKRYGKAHRTDTLPYGMPDRRRAVRPVLRHGRRLSERTLRHASLVEPESSATIHHHKESPHTKRRVTAQAEGHGPESPRSWATRYIPI